MAMENSEIEKFFSACDEFINGKFILADIKIAKLLRAITESPAIYNIVAENLINYDYKKESVLLEEECKAKNDGNLILPDDKDVVIPYVFSLLVEIDSKQVNFNEYLENNFVSASSQKEEYEAFAYCIIIPFKNAIAKAVGLDIDDDEENCKELKELNGASQENIVEKETTNEKKEEVKEIEEKDEETLLFDRLSRMAGIIDDKLIFINKPVRRSNIELLVDALKEASRMQNIKIILALVMALNEFAHRERKIKRELDEINSICLEFFKE